MACRVPIAKSATIFLAKHKPRARRTGDYAHTEEETGVWQDGRPSTFQTLQKEHGTLQEWRSGYHERVDEEAVEVGRELGEVCADCLAEDLGVMLHTGEVLAVVAFQVLPVLHESLDK